MNKKFSTLVAGLALCTAFTANAKVENGKVYQLTNEDGKYLSVTESYTKTDSLILADAPTADIKNTDYQKSLWKVTYRFVSLANTWAYTLTNSATGRVLTLDKQAEWNFKNLCNFKGIGLGCKGWRYGSNHRSHPIPRASTVFWQKA